MTDTPPKRIVIFDDDTDILNICTYILEERGWEVHAFADCTQILQKIASVNPQVILMDNWIPDIGGIKATQLLKANPAYQHIKVVYFSANNDIRGLAAQAGADTYLAKPFDIDDLEKVINRALQQG